jgi:hypothetical protein
VGLKLQKSLYYKITASNRQFFNILTLKPLKENFTPQGEQFSPIRQRFRSSFPLKKATSFKTTGFLAAA